MDKQGIKLGLKIKQRRTAQKMTLKTLSNKTNLSISYLSQVERGQTSIAIASLSRVAEALGEDVSYFIEAPLKYVDYITRNYEQEIVRGEESRYYYNQLGHEMDDRKLGPMIINIMPSGEGDDIPVHTHHGEEFIYVLEGILTVRLGGEKYVLDPGDSIHDKSHIPHKWANYTSKLVKIISVSTPVE